MVVVIHDNMARAYKYDLRRVKETVLRILNEKKFMVYWDLEKEMRMSHETAFNNMKKLTEEGIVKKIKIRTSNKPRGYNVIFVLAEGGKTLFD